MEKIDRLGWAAGLAVVSYGVSIGLRTDEPEALDGLVRLLPSGWRPATSPQVERLYSFRVGDGPGQGIRRFSMLYRDETRIARSLEQSAVLNALESELQLYLAERARGRIFVHAGVVGWRGRAVVRWRLRPRRRRLALPVAARAATSVEPRAPPTEEATRTTRVEAGMPATAPDPRIR